MDINAILLGVAILIAALAMFRAWGVGQRLNEEIGARKRDTEHSSEMYRQSVRSASEYRSSSYEENDRLRQDFNLLLEELGYEIRGEKRAVVRSEAWQRSELDKQLIDVGLMLSETQRQAAAPAKKGKR